MWFIRGLRPDGSFYGELRITLDGELVGTRIEGKLTECENQEIHELVASISDYDATVRLLDGPCDGLIALGAVGHPSILLQYRISPGQAAGIGHMFERIITLLEPHMAKAANALRDLALEDKEF